MSYRFTKASLLTGTIMAGAMMAAPLAAQTTATNNTDDLSDREPALQAAPDEAEGLIVVTGSRIARRDLETAAPVAVVNSEEFELSGSVNVESVINTLPQVVPGTTSFSNNPGDGTATLNLRGLGAARTLVLVNGRRWMFYNTAQVVDLNTIPQFLLDSVDVVTGGASAVYGSDAIAGVVNFRLKDVQGVEVGGQYSLTERGDGARFEVHGAIGSEFADGRGNATVYAEYYKRNSVFQGDRDFSRFALGGETDGDVLQQFGSSTLPSGVLRYLGGAQGNTGLPAGTEFGAAGSAGFGTGVVFDEPANFRRRAGDLYNYAPVNYLQLPQERYLLGGYADFEIGDGHRAYTEVSYVNNRVEAALAATPVTGEFNISLATAQPFLVASDFAQLQAIDAAETIQNAADGVTDDPGVVNFFVQRRIVETGLRENLDERNAFRVLGGVTGPIGSYLNYDAYYMYARTRNANIQQGNISRRSFQAALDGSAAPANIFGPNTLTPSQVDAITIQAQNGDVSSLQVATAVISGTFGDFAFTDASDPIGFAIGTEYRKVAAQFIPDTALASGDVIGFNAGEPTNGEYDVRELFAELAIPIRFGSATLDISGAARYSDYSSGTVGGVWTYAGGVEFAPIPDVKFRAQYQRAVRAPNVGELFGGRSIGFPGATDPCAVAGAQNDPTVNALCIATGVDPASVGDPNIRPNTQVPALFGGNPNLNEETSDSYTFGVVVQPQFIPGLSVTADYFNFKIEDAIATRGGGLNSTLNLCYNVVQDINSPFCQLIVGSRTGNGAITTANPPVLIQDNTAKLEVSGIDLQVSYGTTVPFSIFTDSGEQGLQLSFLGTWNEKNDLFPVQGFETVNECAGFFGATCGEPTPEFKWTSRASFIDGPVTTSIRWRHVGSVSDDDDGLDYVSLNGIEQIDSYDLIDLTFSFTANERLTFNAGVNNLFDTLPGTPTFDASGIVTNRPNSLLLGDNQEQANTYPSTYDVLGRDFFISASYRF